MNKREPVSVDAFIGNRIREIRQKAGVSQGALAAAVGVTFQQVQKYENGTNRIAVSRLLMIARALRVRPGVFLNGAPEVDREPAPSSKRMRARAAA